MAKVGKLSKLKSALKSSFRNLGHTTTTTNKTTDQTSATVDYLDEQSVPALGLQTVYVGKSRRPYQISSQVIKHPSFQALFSRSDDIMDGCDGTTSVTVACEVVLFEHLLWMLDSVDPQTESLDDLVALYA